MPQTLQNTVFYFLLGISPAILLWLFTLLYLRRQQGKQLARHTAREAFFSRVVVCIAVPVAFYYIYWRGTNTINWEGWWSGLPLFVAELYGIIVASIHFFTVWRLTERQSLPPIYGRSIDVFITTYNESIGIIRKTAYGCVAMHMPHTTYILDDGNRPEVAALAKELGCIYITRKENTSAKAGNLNNALRQTNGEFVAVFDADHVPQPQFLEALTGYFVDEKLAFVQTPQDFYNTDSYQHRLDLKRKRIWEEQRLFFSVIQAGKDHWNAAIWCGSSAIFRRSALESIGGITEETVTEDMHTSIRLHAKGYRSFFHNKSLAYGLAPETFVPFQIQRLRWGEGSMQLFFHRDNPFWIKGLNFKQRLAYSSAMTTYFDGFQKLVFYSIPMLYFLTGVLPIVSFNALFMIHFLPYFILFVLAHFLMARGKGSFLVDEQYNIAKVFIFIRSTTALIRGRGLRFKVTPKASGENATFRLLLPQLSIFLMNAVGAGVGIFRYLWIGDLDTAAFFANLFWALCIAGYAMGILRFSQKKVQRRRDFRFWFFVPCLITVNRSDAIEGIEALSAPLAEANRVGLVRDCHEYGASLLSPFSVKCGEILEVTLVLEKQAIVIRALVIAAETAEKGVSGFYYLNTKFIDLQRDDRYALIKYSFDFAVPSFLSRLNPDETLFDRSENLLRADTRGKKRWSIHLPISYRFSTASGPCEVLGVSEDISESGQSILCAETLPLNEVLVFTIDLVTQNIEGRAVVLREKKIQFGGIARWHYALKIEEITVGDLSILETLGKTDYLLRA